MKAFTFIVFPVFVAISIFIHIRENEIGRLQSKAEVTESQISLLRDQVADMEAQGTYAQGFADGVVSSEVSGYTDGYHAALRQLSPKTLITNK